MKGEWIESTRSDNYISVRLSTPLGGANIVGYLKDNQYYLYIAENGYGSFQTLEGAKQYVEDYLTRFYEQLKEFLEK